MRHVGPSVETLHSAVFVMLLLVWPVCAQIFASETVADLERDRNALVSLRDRIIEGGEQVHDGKAMYIQPKSSAALVPVTTQELTDMLTLSVLAGELDPSSVPAVVRELKRRSDETLRAAAEFRERLQLRIDELGHRIADLRRHQSDDAPARDADHAETAGPRSGPHQAESNDDTVQPPALIESLLLGRREMSAGKPQDAERAFREAIAANPAQSTPHNLLGNALFAQQRYAEAEGSYRDAVRLDSRSGVAHANLAGALLKQDRIDEAAVCAQRAVRLGMADHWVLPLLSQNLIKRAGDATGQRDWSRAEALLRQAVELSPNSSFCHNELGNALNAQHAYADAEIEYRHAIRLKPDNAMSYANLAGAMFKQNRLDDAKKAARQAIELGLDSSRHWVFGMPGMNVNE